MERIWLPLLCATILVQVHGSQGCLKEEKTALLSFKQYAEFNGGLLATWADDAGGDCCGWEGVTCDFSSSHVIKLSLDRVVPVEDSLSLNFSLFLPFKQLRSLNLSCNYFTGWIPMEGYGGISTLKMLETLDLSSNNFSSSILKPLSALKSLRNLILADNSIGGYFPFQELSAFGNLELLDLSTNGLSNTTTRDFNALSKLKKLRTLNLAHNNFDTEIFKYMAPLPALRSLFLHHNGMEGHLNGPSFGSLVNLSKLEVLSLQSNQFFGPLPQSLCEMKKLRELDLSTNHFEGPLPLCLGNLSSLRGFDVSSNNLTGNIPLQVIASLTSLDYLSLSHNRFEGLFSMSILANHSNLKLLSLEMEENSFHVDTENPPYWIPSFQLQVLDMPGCKLNMPTGSIPFFLFRQHDLQYIDLSGNNLVGTFPSWLFFNNSNLEFVLLNDNLLNGPLEVLNQLNHGMQWNQMKVLKISDNNIRGQIPENIGNFFPNLEYLNASRNEFDGEIPVSFGNLSNLWMMDLSYNNFTGEVPRLENCTSLSYLKLSYNRISGNIFPRATNLPHLCVLLLDNNQFNGTLTDGLKELNALYALGICNNKLSGSLPGWIGNFADLGILSMSGNNFEGAIPKEICSLNLVYINLSNNKFSGSIPACFTMSKLKFLHLQKNSLVGSIPKAMFGSFSLMTLDLGSNNFSGKIPDEIDGLENLRALLLGSNNLSGQLPNRLCQLKELRLLDLSNNKFSGKIPACFGNMSFGKGEVAYESTDISTASTYIYVAEFLLEFSHAVVTNTKNANVSVEEMEFRTKTTLLSYRGSILNFMSILDLSSNQFSGEIPWQMGDLVSLHSLNLSHNFLNGSIPENLHKMKQLESLDLSFNNLSGKIPPQLQELQFLSFFNVSYNKLSGRAPEMGQFATFDENSYKGNPNLSWLLEIKGSKSATSAGLTAASSSDSDGGESEFAIDLISFYWSFGACYVTVLLILVTIIWINPCWRMAWFNFIDTCVYVCVWQFQKYVLW